MLEIATLPVTPFEQNCRLLRCSETGETVIIDPGGERELIRSALGKCGAKPSAIWLTHSHLDHCGAAAALLDLYKCPLLAHPAEREMRAHVENIAAMYGLLDAGFETCPEPTELVIGGETLKIGALEANVLFTPGHSPGHVCFYFKSEKILIAGDTLFSGSIGRTDLPGGNHELLIESIRKEILSLPDDVRVLSGHGADTTVGRERNSNPFLG